MGKKNKNYIVEKKAKVIKEIRENKVNNKPTRTQEKYVDYLNNTLGIMISEDALKKYEQGTRCCTINTFLQLASDSDIDLNEFKEQLAKDNEYQQMKDYWKETPADLFLCIAIEHNIDLNKLKDS